IHEARKDGRNGQDEPGKINFGDHALIFHDYVGGGLQRGTEVHPGNERCEIKNGVWQAVGGKSREAAEEKCENGHEQERLEKHPENADRGLFVADFDVAPDKKIKKFAVSPEFGEAEMEEAAPGLDARDNETCLRRRG